MKKIFIALTVMLTQALAASAMSYEQARNEALFLTDKMAYELNLSDAQYEAAYEINLDYLMSVASYDDVFGTYWERRNLDLSYILYSWQWDAFRAASYFYRPLYWEGGYWHFGIYARYPRRDYFYFGRPHFYATYRGGHSWHMNGGRSFYHGRTSHFRPELPRNRSHFGLRDSYNRGDYRGGRLGNSSTRVTAGDGNFRNNRHNSGNFSGRRNDGNFNERNNGNYNNGNYNNGQRNNGNYNGQRNNGNYNGQHGNNNYSGQRSNGNGSFSGSRSNNLNSIPSTTMPSQRSNSFSSGGGSRSGSFSSGSGSRSGSFSSGGSRSGSFSSGSGSRSGSFSSGGSRSGSFSSGSSTRSGGGMHSGGSSSHGSSGRHGSFSGSRR